MQQSPKAGLNKNISDVLRALQMAKVKIQNGGAGSIVQRSVTYSYIFIEMQYSVYLMIILGLHDNLNMCRLCHLLLCSSLYFLSSDLSNHSAF